MEVHFSFNAPIEPNQLRNLLDQTDWAANRTTEELEGLLDNSPLKLSVWRGEKLIGFARVLTDDRYRALIDDVVVDATERGQGLGTEIMHQLLDRLRHVEQIFVACGDTVVPFYKRFGFRQARCNLFELKRDTEQSPGADME